MKWKGVRSATAWGRLYLNYGASTTRLLSLESQKLSRDTLIPKARIFGPNWMNLIRQFMEALNRIACWKSSRSLILLQSVGKLSRQFWGSSLCRRHFTKDWIPIIFRRFTIPKADTWFERHGNLILKLRTWKCRGSRAWADHVFVISDRLCIIVVGFFAYGLKS